MADENGAGTAGATRSEHDLIGDLPVPADAYYGVHTARALRNFAISGTRVSDHPEMVVALACVKQAAAEANRELGLLPAPLAEVIVAACREIREGRLHDQFVVDLIQGGAGTSTNMNANEVIANRALELLGHPRGDYAALHPLDHVNASQSTNDAYPTAVKLALHLACERLLAAMDELRRAFAAKSDEFVDVLKLGRTQLQDAVPMTLGQEFGAYAVTLGEDQDRLTEATALLREINLGATAIGTGINADPRYAATVRARLSAITGLDLITAPHLVEATSDVGVFVQLSGVLKRIAVKLSKTCNDLRLLSSGPTAGLNEINLPAVQAGSSIMPGKINPVIPEVVNQIAFQVIGNDVTVTLAAEAGQLQLNAFEPVILASLMQSLRHLREGARTLTEHCVRGITANVDHLREVVEHSVGLVTALSPAIGYEQSSAIAAEALLTRRPIAELVLERGLLDRAELDRLLAPANLVGPLRAPFPSPNPDVLES
jgi:aspartate ammonia-lyase